MISFGTQTDDLRLQVFPCPHLLISSSANRDLARSLLSLVLESSTSKILVPNHEHTCAGSTPLIQVPSIRIDEMQSAAYLHYYLPWLALCCCTEIEMLCGVEGVDGSGSIGESLCEPSFTQRDSHDSLPGSCGSSNASVSLRSTVPIHRMTSRIRPICIHKCTWPLI